MNEPTLSAGLVEYGLGVALPAATATIGAFMAHKSAWYAAWRQTDKGKAFRKRLEVEVERRALARYEDLLAKRATHTKG